MRPVTACLTCHKYRRKCVRIRPNQPCKLCARKHITCSFAKGEAFRPGKIDPRIPCDDLGSGLGTTSETSRTELPPMEVCRNILELYFDYIHGTSHSIFHRPSVAEDLANRTLPDILLYAIVSLAARFSNDAYFDGTSPRTRGVPYARESERLLNLRDISLTTIQACILIGACATSEGDAASELVYYSVAHRNAILLGLPNVAGASPLESEIYNRVWWQLRMMDLWLSNAFGHPYLMDRQDGVPLPMEEIKFLQLARNPRPPFLELRDRSSQLSLFAQMVHLSPILADVGVFNREAALRNTDSSETADESIAPDLLERRLGDWYHNLPSNLRDTSDNFARYGALGLGGMFAAVFLGYYHYGQLLFYQYLHDDCLEFPAARRYAAKCRDYSTALCETVYRAYATPNCSVYYSMVGHVLVIASTVQLQILTFSNVDAEVKDARSRLEHNFKILTDLQSLWPSIDNCLGRFREFHQACQRLRESSFRMDAWMLKFLFDFTKQVSSKPETWMLGPSTFSTEGLDLLGYSNCAVTNDP